MFIKKSILSVALACLFIGTSCESDPMGAFQGDNPIEKEAKGFYVLCSGGWQKSNASLSYYDLSKGNLESFTDANGAISNDFFFMKTKRKLGDNANDIAQYGSKIYIVVSESGTIEVIDANKEISIKQIDMKNEKGENHKPRHITFYKNNAYVCCFDGTVAQIDTTSLAIKGFVSVGINPDGICATNNKIYVSNSGGYSFDETVSVINPETFTEMKKIKVRQNPGEMGVDNNGNIYVVSRGQYNKVEKDYDYRLHLIDTKTDEVKKEYNYKAYNFKISGNLMYMYGYKDKVIQIMDTNTGEIIKDNFITDNTTFTAPYCIEIAPKNGDVYITDAGNYTSNGLVYCFDKSGKRKFTISAGGIIPNGIIFKK